MAAPTNHWKLGLFVLLGAAMILSAIGVLGARSMRKAIGRYVSYFDESVQGLEVGSPVKFRGVTIGTVGKIDVAPDRRHVEVTSELGKAELSRLGLDVAAGLAITGSPKKLVQAVDLRVQLASSGLTGVKFLELDFFPVARHPRPVLPFPVPKNYIPATASMMKGLESSLARTMASVPQIADQVTRILGHIDTLVAELADRKLIEQTVNAVTAANKLIGEAQRKLAQLEPARLSRRVEDALAVLGETGTRVSGLLARVERRGGLLESVQRASSAFGDTARTVTGLGGQLDETLRAFQEAARSIHLLAGALEKEPDMLVKGREKQR